MGFCDPVGIPAHPDRGIVACAVDVGDPNRLTGPPQQLDPQTTRYRRRARPSIMEIRDIAGDPRAPTLTWSSSRPPLVATTKEEEWMPEHTRLWDASECALVLIDYQDSVLGIVFEQDRRVIALNARTLAKAALDFKIPVILSTVGVEMGVNGPTIPSLRAALANVKEIDRSNMNAWEDPKFIAAVKATGRKRLVMGGIVTSVCLAFAASDALADGFEVSFVVDAVGDTYKECHDAAVLRLTHAGAVPRTTSSMIAEWFRDWKSPLAEAVRTIYPPYYEELAALKQAPESYAPAGLVRR